MKNSNLDSLRAWRKERKKSRSSATKKQEEISENFAILVVVLLILFSVILIFVSIGTGHPFLGFGACGSIVGLILLSCWAENRGIGESSSKTLWIGNVVVISFYIIYFITSLL